ncbi:autotransporter outer membrane beta-barrel domain-containing protein [Limnobaculum parvum]|uniref:Autotransporter domain-containing protein n=1 Tax=Limnobaculum parvum TaxID=2172103 RepID=A0A2Y9TZ91_9GAMM|nr:autotransporter domain-containing protein [Limnobaculum parvum]AWH89063.1 autotransporter domain-containing protein [Limnobaculum parvum]
MKKAHPSRQFAFKKNIVLLGILSTISSIPAYADDIYWTNGSGDNQFKNAANWSSPNIYDLNNDRYIQNTNGQTIQLTLDDQDQLYGPGYLFVGYGDGNSASLKMTDNSQSIYQLGYGTRLVVGSNAGTGLFEYQHGDIRSADRIGNLATLDIGSGLNSNGKVTLLGTGKNISDQTLSNSIMKTQELHIGSNGGKGELNTISSEIEVDSEGRSTATTVFTLGDGLGSQGTMNVLAGGKATIAPGPNQYTSPSAIIGLNQGQGTLNISGSVINNGETSPSRVIFNQGLEVGNGTGSNGSVLVLDGGHLMTLSTAQDPNQTGAYIGIDGGKGSVLISGTESNWDIAGNTITYTHQLSKVGSLSIGESGSGDVTIANGGRVSIGAISYVEHNNSTSDNYTNPELDNSVLGNLYLGNQANGMGSLNFGAAENQAAQAVGTLEANQIIFGAGNGSVVFNHTDNAGQYLFDTEMVSSAEGQGSIKQVNGVTTFNTDRSAFTGKTYITGGTLVVNNTLGGTIFASNSGTLAGIGNVGHATIGSGGIISPGQFGSTAPETLTINGNLVMESGSTYLTHLSTDVVSSATNTNGDVVNTYNADVIQVNGSATLNGASVIAIAGGEPVLYVPDSRWRILSATSGVSGAFGPLESRPYVNMGYEYDADNAYLVVTRNDQDICTKDMTSNECNIGGNVDEQGNSDIKDEIISQPDVESAKDVLNQLSGEIHASTKSALLEDSRFLREAVNNRLHDMAVGTGSWGHIYTSWGTFDNTDNAAKMKRNIAGVILGADKSLDDTWKVGLAGGYGKADITVSDRSSSADRYDYHVSAYTKGQWGNFNLHTGVGYTWHDYTTDRYVQLQKLRDHLEANYNASTAQVFTEGRYQFDINDTMTIEPYVDAAYVHVETDDFTESGGKAKLHSPDDNLDIVYTTLGNRFTQRFILDNGQVTKLWGNLGWRHAYGDVTSTASLNFGDSNSFNVIGTSISRDVAILEAGTEISVTPDTNIGVMYNGQIGNNTEDHGAKVYINWHF